MAAASAARQNYADLFSDVPDGALPAGNSLLVVLVSVPLTLLTASLAGFGLAQLRGRVRGRLVIFTVFLLMVPPSAVWLFRYQMLSWTACCRPVVADLAGLCRR